MALEGDDAEEQREQRGNDERPGDRQWRGHQRLHEPRQLGQAVPLHEIGDLAAVAGRMRQRVVDLHRQGDEVGPDPEIDRLAQAEDARKAPDEIDAEGEYGEAEELADQLDHIAVGAAVVGGGADQGHDGGAEQQCP